MPLCHIGDWIHGFVPSKQAQHQENHHFIKSIELRTNSFYSEFLRSSHLVPSTSVLWELVLVNTRGREDQRNTSWLMPSNRATSTSAPSWHLVTSPQTAGQSKFSLSSFFSLSLKLLFPFSFLLLNQMFIILCVLAYLCVGIHVEDSGQLAELVLSFHLPWDHRIKSYCTCVHCKCHYPLHHRTGSKIASCDVLVPQWEK